MEPSLIKLPLACVLEESSTARLNSGKYIMLKTKPGNKKPNVTFDTKSALAPKNDDGRLEVSAGSVLYITVRIVFTCPSYRLTVCCVSSTDLANTVST